MAALADLLRHLSQNDKKELESVQEEIYELQGKCKSQADTLRLAELYAKQNRILKQEKESEEQQ